MSVANVLNGVGYGQNATEFMGTFNESARNTDPGTGNVANGTAYKILNVDKTGTLDTTGGGGPCPESRRKKDSFKNY